MNNTHMQTNNLSLAFLSLLAVACNSNSGEFDATGNFESDEVIVSAEATGKILNLAVEEGAELKEGAVVGYIDTTQLFLKKMQFQYSIRAIMAKVPNASIQLAAVTEQIETTQREKRRVEALLKDDAATKKQLDDVNSQLLLLQRQYEATKSSLTITTRSFQSETMPLKAQLDQLDDQIKKSVIVNPINGTVLTQYALQSEVATAGKALYKIANLSSLVLRAYFSGDQLSQIKLGQEVEVLADAPEGAYKTYKGSIKWISDKAEFTPKTIQTREERANLVYAVKIKVKNDGYLKLGMYGEVKLKAN